MKAIGVILAGGNNHRLESLTTISGRAVAAMPIGSGYRAIDFPLSSMSNSDINKIAVIVQFNSSSLYDHLSSSKWWNLGRKRGGLFIFSPYSSNYENPIYRGTANAMYQNLKFFQRSNHEYVIISSGDAIYKMDFNDLIKYHKNKENDITIVYKKTEDGEDIRKFGVISIDEDENITDIEEKPLKTDSRNISLGIYIIERKLLIELLETANKENRHDFVNDIIIRYRKVLKLGGFKFDGYWSTLNSVNAYYKTNMDFLKKDIRYFFTKEYPYISTKTRDEPPVKYNRDAIVKNSIVSGGSIIDGTVENSVIFSNVYVGQNVTVKNSILMSGSYISNDNILENVILDKNVKTKESLILKGEENNPVIVGKDHIFY
ncbi:MAG: glucose-1-phosphate adenylyltransferase subunit GlgD [Defluviitaleaceae bacterium]|nr:glucose-1-phosphate adenylyltransferase subunit GlgD [Defluviitaleaceae bacterium]